MAQVNSQTLYCVLQLIDSTWSDIAIIDRDVLQENLELLTDSITDIGDRTISKKRVNYLLDNYFMLFLLLALSAEYRDLIKFAVESNKKEHYLMRDSANPEYKNNSDSPDMYIDLSKYDAKIASTVVSKIMKSMEQATKYRVVMDYAITYLPAEDKLKIGYCISNLFYLIRTFATNNLFMSDTKKFVSMVNGFADDVVKTLANTGDPVVENAEA